MTNPTEAALLIPVKNDCMKHPNEALNMYCSSCNCLICPRCIRDHLNHNVTHVSEMGSIIEELMKSQMQHLENSLQILKNTKEGFEKISKNQLEIENVIQQELNGLISKIHAIFSEIKDKFVNPSEIPVVS